MKSSKEKLLVAVPQSSNASTTPDDSAVISGHPAVETKPVRWKLVTAVLCFVLVAMVVFCYRNTLNSYFLADDFGEVFYMSRIWNGEWNLYWSDWISNTMNNPGMAVYRPWFITTLVIDYFFFHGNAAGYYASNIAYFAADVVLFYFVVRQLTSTWTPLRSLACSFAAAALFGLSPLHCESISWVGGRTDTICATFFLAGLLCFLLARTRNSWLLTAGAVLAYTLGILTKEMAIGLPVVAAGIAFINPKNAPHPETPLLSGVWQRAIGALKETSYLWIATVIYFVARYLALGTILGGYTAGLGAAQSMGALSAWMDLDSYRRFILPFGIDIVSPSGSLAYMLIAAYAVATFLLILRLGRGEIAGKNLMLLGVWIAASILPIYKLWGIGPNLEGARYCFFLTIPCSLALPLLLFSPPKSAEAEKSRFTITTTVVAVLALGMMLFVNARALMRTNREWVAAGQQVHAITNGVVRLVEKLPQGKERALIFSVPKTHMGAHMIYNGPTLMTALKPPFRQQDYESKVESADHLFFGLDRFINASRFKQLLSSGRVDGPYAWDLRKHNFIKMSYGAVSSNDGDRVLPLNIAATAVQVYTNGGAEVSASPDGQTLHLSKVRPNEGLRFGGLNLNPLDVDFVEVEYRFPKESPTGATTFEARWQGSEKAASLSEDLRATREIDAATSPVPGDWQTVHIPLSHYWRWYGCGRIDSVSVFPPSGYDIEIRKIALLSDNTLRPRAGIVGGKVDGSGVHYVNKDCTITFDAGKIPGATGLRIESTKQDFFFDQGASAKTGLHSTQNAQSAQVTLPFSSKLSPRNCFSEIRAQALDSQGRPIGEPSDAQVIFAQVQ